MDHAKCGGGGGATLHHHDLAGTNLADGIRFDQVEGAGLGGDDERVGETSEDERTKPVGIARGVDAAGGEHGDRIGALHARERVDEGPLQIALARTGDEVEDHLRVRHRVEDGALFL